MSLRNLKLKVKLQSKYGTLVNAAKNLDVNYSRLSHLINSVAPPSIKETYKLVKIAGCVESDFAFWNDDRRYDEFRAYYRLILREGENLYS